VWENADLVGHLHRLIAFEIFDGTIVDSRRDLADSANELIVELGGSPLPEEAIARMVGDGRGHAGPARTDGRTCHRRPRRPRSISRNLRHRCCSSTHASTPRPRGRRALSRALLDVLPCLPTNHCAERNGFWRDWASASFC
jgi:hypothetical protein